MKFLCLRAWSFEGTGCHRRYNCSHGAVLPSVASGAPTPRPPYLGPLSASGCNDSVCIDLQGSGSKVDDWETTAWASAYVCTEADYWANDVLEQQGTTQCVQGGTELVSDWDNTSWPNGTVLCNTWPGISGRPCETIEG